MKKQVLCTMAIACVVLLGTIATFGGTRELMRVTIPFEFKVGKQTLPAGEYSIETWDMGDHRLAIRSVDGKAEIVVTTIDMRPSQGEGNRSEVLFNKYGDTCFLASIWPGAGYTGKQLLQSRQEREMLAQTRNAEKQTVGTSSK